MVPPGITLDGAAPTTRVRNVRDGMSLALYGADSGYVGFSPPAIGDGTLWELPGADGTEGQFLQTNGDGTLSWVSMQTPGMLATPTVLRSPVALPAELLPLLVDADGQTSTLDTVDDYRSLLGLGSAATADVGDFDAAGGAAAVAAALSSHEALTTTAHGGIASYGTGVSRSVAVRNGTGRDLTDSLLTIDATTGLASLRGTAAAYLAYGPTGVPYTSLSHDGTNGILATSSGDLTLSPASGITALAASQKIKWGAAGTGMQLSLTVGSNPQLNVRDHTDSYYARIRADTYYWNNGEFLYSDNAKMKFRKAFDAAYLPIWAGTLRAYDANTNYTELSHDGTNGKVQASSGGINLYHQNVGGTITLTSRDYVYRFTDGTGNGFINPAMLIQYGNVKVSPSSLVGFSSLSPPTGGSIDTALERVGPNILGVCTGTAGNRAALYAGTVRAYDANTNYAELSHDGTNGKVQASSGCLLLASPNGNGIRVADYTSRVDVQSTLPTVHLLSNASVIRLGDPAGSVVYGPIIHRVASNCQYGIASDINATAIADIAFMRAGANIGEITTGTSGARAALYTGTQRVYDQAGNTNYLTLGHTGTNAYIGPNTNDLELRASGAGTNRIAFCDPNGNARWYFNNTTGAIESPLQYAIKWTGQSVGLYPNAAGVLEINSGTAGAYRDLYLRSLTASQNIQVGNGFWLAWPNAVGMMATDAGTLLLSSFGASTANRIVFNGQTAAYPALKRNGAGIDVRLADDSAYGDITAQQLNPGTAADVSIGGSVGADMFHAWVSSNAGVLGLRSNGLYGLTNSATNAGGAVDIALGRYAAGVAEINNGSAHAYRDLYTRTQRVYDAANTGYMEVSHDGTNVNFLNPAGVASTSSFTFGSGSSQAYLYANGGISAGASITAGTNFYTTSYGGGIGAGGTHMTFENGYTNFSQRGVFTAASASVVPVTIKAAASQSGNLFEIRNSANTLTTWMQSDNHLVIGATGVARTATAISLNGNGSSHGCISLRGAPNNDWGFYALGYDSTRDASAMVTYSGRRLVLGEHTSVAPFSGSRITPRLMYVGDYWRADPKWFMGNGETHATPSDAYLSATGGSGANVAGASFYHDAGQGTGTGAGGSHIFRVAPAGSAGSSLNTLATALSINSNSVIGLGGNTSSDPALKKSGTALQVRLGDDSAYTSLYTGTQRVYDPAGNTNYLALSHDGTNAKLTSSSGNIRLSPASGTVEFDYFGTINQTFGPGGVTVVDAGGTIGFRNYNNAWATVGWACKSNEFQFGQTMVLKWNNANAYHSGSTDTGIARRSAGAIESNNGTAGTLRDVYARTFYGVAQAATDAAVCAQAHASQGSTSPILKVITSAGGDLFRVLPDRTVVGPDMTLDLPTSTDGASATGRNGFRTGYGAMYLRSGNTDNLVVSANLLQVGGGGASTVIQCADRGSSLTLNVIDHYGNANLAGKDLIYQVGRGTGTADGGTHRFKVAPAVGVSGTTFGTLVDALTIASTKVFTLADGAKWSNGSVTGTTHGTSSADKQAWWNSTPVAQSTGWGDWGTYTELKAFDPATVTLGELARFVATLSATLKSYGLLGA
jgi:hypothetical protein